MCDFESIMDVVDFDIRRTISAPTRGKLQESYRVTLVLPRCWQHLLTACLALIQEGYCHGPLHGY